MENSSPTASSMCVCVIHIQERTWNRFPGALAHASHPGTERRVQWELPAKFLHVFLPS